MVFIKCGFIGGGLNWCFGGGQCNICASYLLLLSLIGVMGYIFISESNCGFNLSLSFMCCLITSLISLAAWVAFLMSGRSATVV